MAFIRFKSKKPGGPQYAYIVESYRNAEGKPRQRVLHYIGRITTGDAFRALLATKTRLSAMARRKIERDIDRLMSYLQS